ncbi:MAG: four helix bundle protein [Firmicutes bacterium]|nr:four helix bundle protein [Bacillota bacterium]
MQPYSKEFLFYEKNLLLSHSLKFSAKIIKLQQYLIKQKKEAIISKQIIRSATSIGANINEANYGSSKADFIAKMQIALKETAETEYWIRLLKESEYITEDMFNNLIKDCLSIKKMLVATLNTAKKNT